MKARTVTLAILACLMMWNMRANTLSLSSDNISSRDDTWNFPLSLNGTMMAYDFNDSEAGVPWDTVMRPVFIDYIARHGARYLSSEKKVGKLSAELEKAKREGRLSRHGDDFLALLHMVDSVTDGRWGALNSVGMMEERRLGQEMYAIAPGLLKNARVEARATYVPRVVMTMYELCHELAVCSSEIEITTMEGRQFDSLLRYFKTDSAYVEYLENGPWKKIYDDYVNAVIPETPAARLFSESGANVSLRSLTLDMYGVIQSLPAAGITSVNPEEWFSEDEYSACWKADNLRHYYQRSASRISSLPAESARPLLRDIVASADSALDGTSGLDASLRFGHAETVIPLFALMRMPGCFEPDLDPESVADHWKDWEVSPLGANLLIVILKDNRGDSYAAMRLNGRWIDTDGKKVVRWTDLKRRWNASDKNI